MRGPGSAEPGAPNPQRRDENPQGQLEAARAIVLRQLTAMPRSRQQLRVTLAAKGIADEVATAVLDRFEAVGLVDDAAYAGALVRSKREQRGLSRRALAHEMRVRGVDDATAAGALAGVSEEDEYATAVDLARRKAHGTRGLDRQVRERRIGAMLARKGYSADVVLRATRTALAETGETPDEGLVGR